MTSGAVSLMGVGLYLATGFLTAYTVHQHYEQIKNLYAKAFKNVPGFKHGYSRTSGDPLEGGIPDPLGNVDTFSVVIRIAIMWPILVLTLVSTMWLVYKHTSCEHEDP